MPDNKIYTRTGTVQNDRAPFRKYTFPVTGSTNDNITIMIPYNATKRDVDEAIEHMKIIADHWVEE